MLIIDRQLIPRFASENNNSTNKNRACDKAPRPPVPGSGLGFQERFGFLASVAY